MNVLRCVFSLFISSVALFTAVESPAWGQTELVVTSRHELQRYDAVSVRLLAEYLLPFGDRSADVAVGPDQRSTRLVWLLIWSIALTWRMARWPNSSLSQPRNACPSHGRHVWTG